MKKSFHTALLPFLSLVLVVLAVGFSFGPNRASTASAATPSSPAVDWTNPQNVSQSPSYDNTTDIAATSSDAVTLAWEQRDLSGAGANLIQEASNTSLGGAFNMQTMSRGLYKQNGSASVATDPQGRRHIVFWQSANGPACNYYSLIEANGTPSIRSEELPGSCGANRKTTSIAVGPDGTVHIMVGWIGHDMVYYQRSAAGQWTVIAENVPIASYPESANIAVSTTGLVMVGWKDLAPTTRSDIYTAVRNSPGNWTVEDISFPCCSGCPNESSAYTPSLAANYSGGFSMAWADEKCDPRGGTRALDVYYREWVPGNGWNNQPLVRVYSGGGEAYFVALTVDTSNTAHITWSDDSGRSSKDYTFLYTSGSGTSFAPVSRPFVSWSNGSYIKESAIDFGGGYVHVSFSSARDDPNKEAYYARAAVNGGPPPPATFTPVPPVATATPTPVRCPGQRFTDVCPGDTFYQPIMDLVNLGVIGGYNDGTFRPQNNLTRAQAAKIIALTANLPANLEGAPHFADVTDPNNVFFTYIEFASNAGIISGYRCGGPGEPCDTQNRPYFRPDNNVTRGQLSKMTSQAFGFDEPVVGASFTDVPATSPFYLWIERMAHRGIINGYQCGGPGEPCINDLPYFRPGANVTRGQASKIIDGARLQPTPTPTALPTNTFTPTFTPTAVPTSTATSTPRVESTATPTP